MSASPAGVSSSLETRRATHTPRATLCAHPCTSVPWATQSLPGTAGFADLKKYVACSIEGMTRLPASVPPRYEVPRTRQAKHGRAARLIDRTLRSHAGQPLPPVLVPHVQYAAQEQLRGWQQSGQDAPAPHLGYATGSVHLRSGARAQLRCRSAGSCRNNEMHV